MTNIHIQPKFSSHRLAKLFFLLFIVFIFFPVRYVFPSTSSLSTGLYSDFTSISLYLSDIFLFIAFIFTLWSNSWNFKQWLNDKLILLFIIWLILATTMSSNSISGLNIWYFIKFLELLIVSYGTTKVIFSSKSIVPKKSFLLVFVCLGTLQSVIGLLQFINQSPIGLNLIGEQVIYPNLWGIAKIVSGGTTFIRAYGTFPHPNLLSAFLLTAIFINFHLLISTTWNRLTKIWLNLAFFINILGLTATFSRASYFALGVGFVLYFSVLCIYIRKVQSENVKLIPSFVMLFISVLFSIIIFHPFLTSRATISDQATAERKIYNQTALNMVKDKPIFGLSIGESMLHMKQYAPVDLKPWQIQPIHNFFLLSAAEIGIPGMLLLFWLFISHLKKLVSSIKFKIFDKLNSKYLIPNTNQDIENILYKLTLFAILVCFLLLMQFDHYFYTLQQTQMLLWVVLGLIAVETK